MSLYLDSSALVRRYLDEPEGANMRAVLVDDHRWLTSRITRIEVGRALQRSLETRAFEGALGDLDDDLSGAAIAEIDSETCARALDVACETGIKTLDAIHLATMWKAGNSSTLLLTADRRQARAAMALGLGVHPASST